MAPDNHLMTLSKPVYAPRIFHHQRRSGVSQASAYCVRWTVIPALTAIFFAFVCGRLFAQPDTSENWPNLTLTAAGYPSGTEGARAFLETLKPNSSSLEFTLALVHQLGSEQYSSREAAMLQLSTMRGIDFTTLQKFRNSDNAEIRWRLRKVEEKHDILSASLLSASLSILERSTEPELRELAWNAAVLASDRVCMGNLSRFLATAYKVDVDQVISRLKAADPLTRVVAIETLRQLFDPAKAAEKVRPMLQDPDPMVRLAVCRILADAGERECLRSLATLTGDSDAEISSAAVWLLESLTGHFPESKQVESFHSEQVARYWHSWCDAHGQESPLHFPVGRSFTARGSLQGGMLYATGSLGKIVLADRAGDKIWEYEMPAWSAEKLRNGNILIASFDREEVREVTLDNRVVWRWNEPGSRPIRAKPLPNGNILVADYDGRRVFELGESRKKVWEITLGDDNCFDAERMENGNTLVATPTALIEFHPNKEKVKTWPLSGRINSVQVLPSGNFLVANHGESMVLEMNRQGNVLWRYPEQGASEAYRTEDGHYLITSDRRCIEVSPDRSRVRVLHNATYGSARR